MKLYFRVEELRPDQRQYRQTEVVLVPFNPLTVVVEIDGDYLDDVADDVITLEGLKAIVQQCDLVFMGTKLPNKQSNDDEPNDEEFSE